MRQTGKTTRHPGVFRLNDATYRIRAKVIDPKTGRAREVDRLLTNTTAAEAAKARAVLAAQVRAGGSVGLGGRVRVGDFARSWIESKALTLDAGTANRYAEAMDLHVLPVLGDHFLDALDTADVQGWIDGAIKQRDPRTRRPYRGDTIRGWFRVFRTMVRDAVAQRDLPRDPTLRIRLPESPEREEPNSLTPEELRDFLDAMRTRYPQHYALTAVLAFTGLRFCHASAIKWDDVDEAASVLRVQRKQVRGRVGPVSRRKRAPRELPLPVELATILREHRTSLMKSQAPGLADGWVFPSSAGTLRAPSSLQRAWEACLKVCGITKRFTPHGLRRTFTDLSRRAGVDAVVAKSLTGHVTERMRDHYSTVALDERHAAVRGVLRLVSGNESGDGSGDAPNVVKGAVGDADAT